MSTYIDPHIHMISRVTDDYQRMAQCGCVAVSEPAFLGRVRSWFRRRVSRLFPPPHRVRAEAGRPVRHPALLLAVHQRQGGRERLAVARGHRADPRVPRQAERPRHRRDRPQQEHAQRGHHLSGTRRPGDEDQRTDPHPHAAPGRQVQGHADDRRHAQERSTRQAGPRLHRSRRGTHRPPGPRQRLLVRHDALPDDEMHAGSGPWTSSRWSAPSASWPTRPATGASPTRWRCRNSSSEMKRRGHAEEVIRKVVYDNPLAFWRQCGRWQNGPERQRPTPTATADTPRSGPVPCERRHAKR